MYGDSKHVIFCDAYPSPWYFNFLWLSYWSKIPLFSSKGLLKKSQPHILNYLFLSFFSFFLSEFHRSDFLKWISNLFLLFHFATIDLNASKGWIKKGSFPLKIVQLKITIIKSSCEYRIFDAIISKKVV